MEYWELASWPLVTWLDLTWLDLTWLDMTFLVYGKSRLNWNLPRNAIKIVLQESSSETLTIDIARTYWLRGTYILGRNIRRIYKCVECAAYLQVQVRCMCAIYRISYVHEKQFTMFERWPRVSRRSVVQADMLGVGIGTTVVSPLAAAVYLRSIIFDWVFR